MFGRFFYRTNFLRHRIPSLDDPYQEHDDGHDEQDVDEPADAVHANDAEKP